MTPKIIPSVLVYSEEEFRTQHDALLGVVDFVQVDIADNTFVPNQTWHDPAVINDVMQIDFELHMMVDEPLEKIKPWLAIERLKKIIVHYETLEGDVAKAVSTLRNTGREVCICLNPETPFDVLEDVIGQIDAVQFMTIHPGFQGQPFLPEMVEEIAAFHEANPDMYISTDGHMDAETIPQVVEAGATGLCVGSAIMGNDNTPKENVEALTQLVHTLIE